MSCVITTPVTMGMRGRPGTRRTRTEVFLGISTASSTYSEIKKKKDRFLKNYPHNHAYSQLKLNPPNAFPIDIENKSAQLFSNFNQYDITLKYLRYTN